MRTWFNNKLIFALLAGLGLGLLVLFAGGVFPFSMDSLFYITTAEHIVRFQGFLFSNFSVIPANADVLPSVILHPPGYPVLIALLKFIGVNEYTGALLWPKACFLALPLLFFFVLRRVMPRTPALIAAGVCSFTFAVIKCSLMAWSDVPYLCFALMSFALAFWIMERRGKAPVILIVAAGFLAGYALLIKYIGMTLVASIFTGFGVCGLLSMMPRRTFFKTVGFYGLGFLLVIGPMVVHNMLLFRTALPYKMPPSTVPLVVNLHDYFREMALIVFASPLFEGAVLVMIAAFAVVLIRKARDCSGRDPMALVGGIVLAAYFVYNSAFLIAFKTVCYGPEPIDDRYLIQIAWILLAACVWALHALFIRLRASASFDIKNTTGMLLVSFALIQVFPASDFIFFEERLKGQAAKVEGYAPLLRDLPADYVIVSNVPDLAYYFARRNVRMLAGYTPQTLAAVLGPTKNHVVFLLKEEEFLSTREYFRYWQRAPGYTRVYSDENITGKIRGL